MTDAIAEAAKLAFSAVRNDFPNDRFYYFCLATTGDALRPAPCASSIEGLQRALTMQPSPCEVSDLRWSEADSPFWCYGDHFFEQVEAIFLEEDIRTLPDEEYSARVEERFLCMEQALSKLDAEGFFGIDDDRRHVVVNVVAPGEESEDDIFRRALRLNPAESLWQMAKDFGIDHPHSPNFLSNDLSP
jgi:hypothetical protein